MIRKEKIRLNGRFGPYKVLDVGSSKISGRNLEVKICSYFPQICSCNVHPPEPYENV